jgi:hypothetical protein
MKVSCMRKLLLKLVDSKFSFPQQYWARMGNNLHWCQSGDWYT